MLKVGASRKKRPGKYISPAEIEEPGFYWWSRPFLGWQEIVEIVIMENGAFGLRFITGTGHTDIIHLWLLPTDRLNETQFVKA